ncbi:putative reverse transcriptase domain-containing protein [Tanacetum coccineum]
MLWGIATRCKVDYAELLWEEFVQAIQTFFTHRANLNIPTKKPTPHVIPYCRFTKLIIYYLGIRHNIHRRPVYPVHVTGDDFLLGNIKFVPKGEKDEVFGKPIPQELSTEAIQKSPYYQQYLDIITPHVLESFMTSINSLYTVMSDSEDSTVTYTAVSSLFADFPDIGSPGVDGPPVMPKDPYAYVVAAFQSPSSPDYVSGPEYPPSPEFVSEPVYPEFIPLEDEILLAEEQSLHEEDDEDPEEDPDDYPADGGDDGDDEDESSDDIERDEEEEEHPAPADSTVVALPAVDQASSIEETGPFESDESAATTPPHPAYRVTARISIRDETPISLPPKEEVERLLAMPYLSPSSPLYLLVISIPQNLTSHHYSITLGPRYEVRESSSAAAARPAGGLRADYGFVATIDREIMRDLERDVGYGITDSWDEIVEAMQGTPVVTDVAEFSQRIIEFETRVRQDTVEIYTRLDNEQSKRQLMADRLNMFYRDRHAHARTAKLIETEARMSREAWGRSINASDLACAEVISLRTQVVAQQAVITEPQEADRRRQAVITETLAADRRRQKHFIEALKLLKRLQTQMTEFERQQGPAKGPAQPDAPEEAGSSS